MWSYVRDIEAGKVDTKSFLRRANELGFRHVELLDHFRMGSEQEAMELCGKLGLSVASWSIANDFAVKDLNAPVAKLQEDLRTAKRLGAPVLRVFSGEPKPGMEYEEARNLIIEGFRRCAPLAEELGVTMAIENHGAMSGRGAQVRALINGVGSHNFAAAPDLGSFFTVGDDPVETVKMLLPDVAHVHVWDCVRTAAGSCENTIIGEGCVDIKGVVKVLKDGGYNGVVSMEYEGPEPEDEGVVKSTKYLKDVFESA